MPTRMYAYSGALLEAVSLRIRTERDRSIDEMRWSFSYVAIFLFPVYVNGIVNERIVVISFFLIFFFFFRYIFNSEIILPSRINNKPI